MNGLDRLQQFLIENSYDSILLMSPTNLHYFAGFTGTTAVAFVTPKTAHLITDSRYTEQAMQQCEGYTVIQFETTVWDSIQTILQETAQTITTCAFEGDKVPYDRYVEFQKALPFPTYQTVQLTALRAIKREDELVYMRKAAQIADEAFAAMLPQLRVGMTENEARILLETEMLQRGSTEPSFATIVASGHRSSMPHGVASDKVIEKGDFITFDFGAVYQGYHSDMTRTIVMGPASDKQKKLYDIVLAAQQAGVAAVRAGVPAKTVDAACRDLITEAGYGDYFRHGTGHGVGLEIHELPRATATSEDVLAPHMIVTVEPGIYLPGDMGLRIEDSVIVTNDGCEILTKTPKTLIEVHS